MTVRELANADLDKIQDLHLSSGFQYQLPSFEGTAFPVRQVLSDDSGFAMGIFARKTLEAYFIIDPKWRTPAWRWQGFKMLHEQTRLDAISKGYTDVQALIPPEIEKQFGKRLFQLGWKKNYWPIFSREL